MLVHLGVLLALDGAVGASLGAGLEHALYQGLVAAGAPHGEPGRSQTDIGAVEIEPDALGQRLVGDRHIFPDFT